jgi:hypothetical protein
MKLCLQPSLMSQSMIGSVSVVRSQSSPALKSSQLKFVQIAAVHTWTARAACRLQGQKVAGMSAAGPFSLERFVCLPHCIAHF